MLLVISNNLYKYQKAHHVQNLFILGTPLVPVSETEVPVRVLLPVAGGDIHQEYWRIFF